MSLAADIQAARDLVAADELKLAQDQAALEAARVVVAERELVVLQDQAKLAEDQAALAALLAQQVPDGPDLSQWNGTVDFAKVKAAAGFCFLRVSDGDIRDTAFAGAVAAARNVGLPFGPYHFGRVASPGNDQRNGRVEAGMAIYFARAGGWGKPGDLPLVYDFETLGGQTPQKAATHVAQFVNTYEFIMQHKPIIYTNPGTWDQVRSNFTLQQEVALVQCPLWIAHWGVSTPTVPEPWSDWTFWQFTDLGTLPGVSGRVDLNRFSGGISDLEALKL